MALGGGKWKEPDPKRAKVICSGGMGGIFGCLTNQIYSKPICSLLKEKKKECWALLVKVQIDNLVSILGLHSLVYLGNLFLFLGLSKAEKGRDGGTLRAGRQNFSICVVRGKPGARNSFWVSDMTVRHPSTCHSLLPPRGESGLEPRHSVIRELRKWQVTH